MPLVGFLNAQTAAGYAHIVPAFRQGLNESGFVDGQSPPTLYAFSQQYWSGQVAPTLPPWPRRKQFRSSLLSAAIP